MTVDEVREPAPTDEVVDRLVDVQAIADLMTGWIHRDLGEWDRLRDLFTPGARIEVTWFAGPASDFVDASTRMGASDLRTKHLIASPVIRFAPGRDRAWTETNAIIVVESRAARIGAQAHMRLIDRVERRGGRWRIADRRAVYDFASFTFPVGPVDVDPGPLDAHPVEYAALAHLLELGGFPVRGRFPTRGSDAEREIKAAAEAWLRS